MQCFLVRKRVCLKLCLKSGGTQKHGASCQVLLLFFWFFYVFPSALKILSPDNKKLSRATTFVVFFFFLCMFPLCSTFLLLTEKSCLIFFEFFSVFYTCFFVQNVVSRHKSGLMTHDATFVVWKFFFKFYLYFLFVVSCLKKIRETTKVVLRYCFVVWSVFFSRFIFLQWKIVCRQLLLSDVDGCGWMWLPGFRAIKEKTHILIWCRLFAGFLPHNFML